MHPVENSTTERPRGTRPSDGSLVDAFPLRAFFGHHKCATGWIDGILMEMCFHMGLRFEMVHVPKQFERYGSLSRLVQDKKVDVLAYTNADLDHLGDLDVFRGFHVVRDPRDILVSAYFSHKNSHSTKNWPQLAPHREQLQRLSKEDGLFCEMDFSQPEFEAMARWEYGQPHILELKMEELTANPQDGFRAILRFLELLDEEEDSRVRGWLRETTFRMNRLNHKGRRFMPGRLPMFPVPRRRREALSPTMLERIVAAKSFRKLASGRRRGEEDVHSHYRKGTPGDWRNHLTEAHIRRFKDRHGELLVRLGYEDSLDW